MSNITDGSIYVELKPIKERKRAQYEIMQGGKRAAEKILPAKNKRPAGKPYLWRRIQTDAL